MKKTLFASLIALFSCMALNAQTSIIKIGNGTDCDISYVLVLSTASPFCNAPTIGTSILTIPANTAVTYTNTTYPGYTAANAAYVYFIAARVYAGGTACLMPAVNVGEACTTLPDTEPMSWVGTGCSSSCNGTVKWITPPPLGTNIDLVFN